MWKLDDVWNEKSRLGNHFRTTLNFTYVRWRFGTTVADFLFPEQGCYSYMEYCTALKSLLYQTSSIYTPVINDAYLEVNIIDFFMLFPLIILFALLLKLSSKFSEFNPQTWSFLAVFKMLISLDNPSGVTRSFVESVLFITISISGVFYSNEFSGAATKVLNCITVKTQFNSFVDLRESNLTVFLIMNHSSYSDFVFIDDPIVLSEVKYEVTKNINDDYA